MIRLGKTNHMQIVKEVEFGLYLDGEDFGEVLLPKRYVPAGCKPGDMIDVFVYRDSEDIIIATTERPLAELGECAHLNVVDKNRSGAFMDWGLPKDLFVPLKEQRTPMEPGQSYTVFVFEDVSGRIAASSKLSFFLDEKGGRFEAGQAVGLHIASRSDLGYKAVIDGTHLGLIHHADILAPVTLGDEMVGYIKKIRPDGAIDLMLQPQGEAMKNDLYRRILEDLKDNGGSSSLTDKSTPEDIFRRFGVSKGNYKKILGELYKDKRIVLHDHYISLV
jgi:predicted RNA-binding protein (virulence factor B family)